jgi:hypothetical protein
MEGAEKMSLVSRGFTGIWILSLALIGCRETSNPAGGRSFREQIEDAKRESDTELRAKRLIKIGYQQGKAKDKAGAEETLRLAWEDCDAIADPAAKAGALALMAEANAKLGDDSAARRAIGEAKEAAAKVEAVESKAQTLARVAKAQVAASDPDAAATLQAAEELVAKIGDLQGKTLSLCAVAKAYHDMDKPAERDRVLGIALDAAKSAADPRKRSLAQAEVAVVQSMFDERVATKTFELALESAGKIESPYSRAYALGDIAERLSEAGFRAKTHEVLGQAERAVAKIPQHDAQTQALNRIRTLMGRLPKPAE